MSRHGWWCQRCWGLSWFGPHEGDRRAQRRARTSCSRWIFLIIHDVALPQTMSTTSLRAEAQPFQKCSRAGMKPERWVSIQGSSSMNMIFFGSSDWRMSCLNSVAKIRKKFLYSAESGKIFQIPLSISYFLRFLYEKQLAKREKTTTHVRFTPRKYVLYYKRLLLEQQKVPFFSEKCKIWPPLCVYYM